MLKKTSISKRKLKHGWFGRCYFCGRKEQYYIKFYLNYPHETKETKKWIMAANSFGVCTFRRCLLRIDLSPGKVMDCFTHLSRFEKIPKFLISQY